MTGILRERADDLPREIALSDLDVEFTWKELAELCERGARGLESLRLAPGTRVGVVARNSAETALAYMIARYAGVPLVPVSFHLTASELTHIFHDARVAVVLHDRWTEPAVATATHELGIDSVIGMGEGSFPLELQSWLRTFDAGPLDLSRPAVPNLLYTSGTTGFPKGVLHPQQIDSSVDEYVSAYREEPDAGPFLTVGPLYHAGPLGSIRRVTGGRPLIVLPRFDAEAVLDVIESRGVTGTTMVPTHFVQLLNLPEATRTTRDCASIRWVDHTGSACPVEVKRRMIQWWGSVLVERYGATESGTICTIDSDEWLQHPGSVGRPNDRFRAIVLSDDGEELAAGETGHLYFEDRTRRGIVYEGDEAKTAAAHIRPGVFTLGDLGHVDADGYVFVTGRRSDIVISGGVNLYPAEIERVLLQLPSIADAAVIGVPDETMGERLHAVVVPAEAGLTAEAIREYLRDRLAGPKQPRSIEFTDELPRSPMGKLLRNELRDRFATQF